MKHFTAEEWIDLVNQLVSPSQRQAMESHLEKGCPRCRTVFSRWQRVRRAVEAEGSYQPPQEAVRSRKLRLLDRSGCGTAGPAAESSSSCSTVSCSLPGGVRSVGPGTRRMLYRADPFQVDLQVEAPDWRQDCSRHGAIAGLALPPRSGT